MTTNFRRENARARYIAVRHLDDKTAAAALSIGVRHVRKYRLSNPDVVDAPQAPPKPTPESIKAQYMAVRHLNHTEAAKALGRSVETVRQYRFDHPDASHLPIIATPRKPRDGVYSHKVLRAEPNRSSSVSSVPVMHVSLPAPPTGFRFNAMGENA